MRPVDQSQDFAIDERADAGTRLHRVAPGLARLRNYERRWLPGDVVAGLTFGALLITQCMAYAPLAGLPPSVGFHGALIGIPLYALLGSSRHLAVGPDPGTAALAGAGLAMVAATGTDNYAAAAAALAVLVGLVMVGASLLRLGFLAELLSRPALVGYLTGLGLSLLVGQTGRLTGLRVDGDGFFAKLADIARGLDGLRLAPVTVGLGTLALILLLRRVMPVLPGALIAVVTATVVVAFGLGVEGVATVGEIDAGLGGLALPSVGLRTWLDLVPTAFGIALVGFADSTLTGRGIAEQQGYLIAPNRELTGLGAANLGAGLFGGMPLSSTGSGTAAMASAGGHSSLASLVATGFVAIGLSLVPGVLERIPQPALGAVVVGAALSLIDLPALRTIGRYSRAELALALATAAAVVLFDVLIGVVVSIVLGAAISLSRIAHPHEAILGEGADVDGWVDVALHPEARTLDGLLVYRWDAPLMFANARRYAERVAEVLGANPGDERWLVLDFEGIGSVDTTALGALERLLEVLRGGGIDHVGIARANEPVLRLLAIAGLLADHTRVVAYPTINAAVAAYKRRSEP